MSKGATAMSALVIAVTGGYFAYDYYDSHKAKKKHEAWKPKTGSQQGSNAPGGATGGSEAGSAAGSSASGSSGSSGSGGSGSGEPTAEPVLHKVHEIPLPNLSGKTPEAARTALAAAGFKADVLEIPEGMACTYEDERHPVPVGTICNQEREPGTKVMSNAKIRVVVEHDTWEHGGVEVDNEWHRMPDVTGLKLERAKALLREKGFGDDEFEVGEARVNCGVGVVCDQRPKADGRKYKREPGELNIGH